MSESEGQAASPESKTRRASPWFLYLIECRDGTIYTGITVDVAARYAAHTSGKGARYTRAHPPLRLLASVPYPDRSSASKAEYRIKQLKPADKRRYAEQLAGEPNRTAPVAAAQDFPI